MIIRKSEDPKAEKSKSRRVGDENTKSEDTKSRRYVDEFNKTFIMN